MSRQRIAYIAIAILILMLAAGGFRLMQEDFLGLFDDWIVRLVALFAIIGGIVSLIRAIRPHRHPGEAILWCRRFDRSAAPAGERNRWSQEVLLKACLGRAMPITLRDRSISWARSVGEGLEMPLVLLLVLLGLGGFLWLVVELPADIANSWWGVAAMILLYCSVWVAIVVLLQWFLTSLATFRGNPAKLRQYVRSEIAKGRSRRDILVIRCSDADWRDCVRALLAEASLVVLDVTGSTENIDWEIRQSFDELGSDRVLLFQELTDDRPIEWIGDSSDLVAGVEDSRGATLIRYGSAWIDEERRTVLDNESGAAARAVLGPRSSAIAAKIREWLETPRPEPRAHGRPHQMKTDRPARQNRPTNKSKSDSCQ